jgi:hypothetical protein
MGLHGMLQGQFYFLANSGFSRRCSDFTPGARVGDNRAEI